ncbi:hypothetical protein [Ensifer sp. LBL]|uniref:hypothetical protein n=1 Tax=Ensifer sp. LBL TaxID=2991056 RepID=UPI003D1B87CD
MPIVTEHPAIVRAPSDDQIVWRFMSVEKLLSLLTTSSLYFCQLKLLQRDDPFEGHYTSAQIQARARVSSDPALIQAIGDEFLKRSGAAESQGFRDNIRRIYSPENLEMIANVIALTSYINCWHLNPHESAALWKIYSAIDAGIAIRTTVGRLKSAIRADGDVYLGCVEYVDYFKEMLPDGNAMVPAFRKRVNFSHESELRLYISEMPVKQDNPSDAPQTGDLTKNPPGINVPCDLPTLIEELVVSPLSPAWFVKAIENVVEHYMGKVPVNRSTILSGPQYSGLRGQ